MNVKSKLRLAGMLALLAGVLGCSGQNEAQARQYAESVLRMKDQGAFRAMYREEFNAKMRQAMTEDQWAATAEGVERLTGPLISRELKSSGYNFLFGLYRVRYKTQYQRFKGIDEVVISKEGDQFKVAGLWLKPDL